MNSKCCNQPMTKKDKLHYCPCGKFEVCNPLDYSDWQIGVYIRQQKGKVQDKVWWGDFKHQSISARQLAISVYRNHAFCAMFHERRKYANFVGAWHMCLDFDDNHQWTLETLRMHEYVARFASFVHTTTSHTDEKPRLRVVFLFQEMVTSIDEYKRIAAGLNALYPNCETVATGQVNKVWSGSLNCQLQGVWSLMPKGWMNELRQEGEKSLKRPEVKQDVIVMPSGGNYEKYIEKCFDNAAAELAQCGKGNRNNPLNKIANGLFRLSEATWNDVTHEYVMQWLSNQTGDFWGDEGHRRTAESAMNGARGNPAKEPVRQYRLPRGKRL